MILFINACVRRESRTMRLAECLLRGAGDEVVQIDLSALVYPTVNEAFIDRREALTAEGNTSDASFTLARRFASADRIVIAAPYWDLSFPASLKQYLEQINVAGITFEYLPDGTAHGLCRAKRLDYVTTAGGLNVPFSFGYGYVKALAQTLYGIADVRLWEAQGLDIDGADEEGIMTEAMEKIARENGKETDDER